MNRKKINVGKVLKAIKHDSALSGLGQVQYKNKLRGETVDYHRIMRNEFPADWGEPDSATQWYKPVDHDEFPFVNYLMGSTGRAATHHYRLANGHNDTLCHYPEDLKYILEKYPFQLLHSLEFFDQDEGMILSRDVYQLKNDTGVLLLNVGGRPHPGKGQKLKTNSRISLSVVSNISVDIYQEIVQVIISRYHKPKIESNNVNLVIRAGGGYDTEQFTLPKQTIDIEMNYGKDFIPIHKKIVSSLNEPNGKGLVLLHGDPGTGKTHYLKHLASKIKDKKVLFIPPYLADFITSPEMTPFLIENSNAVLFIEDAERVITDRNENGSTGVSNILNITDGILSDILKIQIVATFNMDRKKIDPALLRKGRLIAEHKFEALSVEESNVMLKHLKIPHVATEPMTLTQIYNFKDPHYISEESISPRRIGFGSKQI
jgi:hypothetical protein